MTETLTAPLEWRTEQRKVKELVPYDYNPRILTENKLEFEVFRNGEKLSENDLENFVPK